MKVSEVSFLMPVTGMNYYYVLTLPTPLLSVRTTSAEERRNIGKDILTE